MMKLRRGEQFLLCVTKKVWAKCIDRNGTGVDGYLTDQ